MKINMTIGRKLRAIGTINLVTIVALGIVLLILAFNIRSSAILTKTESSVFAIKSLHAKMNVIQVQQWLTDISATRAAEGYDDGFVEAENNAAEFRKHMADFKALFQQTGDKEYAKLSDEILTAFEAYYASGIIMANAYIKDGPASGNEMMGGFDETSEKLQEKMGILLEHQSELLHVNMEHVILNTNLLYFTIAVSLIILIALALYMIFALNKSFRELADKITISTREILTASQLVTQNSQQLTGDAISQAASMEQSSSATEEIASQAKESAGNAVQTVDNITHITGMMKQSSEEAKIASSLSIDARNSADGGVQTMNKINKAMDEIRDGSNKITEIIQVINEITHQTKMLATNAAIEAARAGDSGKGFAVVADEVSKLAENSKSAAKEITDLILESTRRTENGSELAYQGVDALTQILEKSTKAADLVNTISISSTNQAQDIEKIENLMENIKVASLEQAQGVDELTRALVDMDKIAQSNAASAEETTSVSEKLGEQVVIMEQLVQEMASRSSNNNPPTRLNTSSSRPMQKGLALPQNSQNHHEPDHLDEARIF